MNQELYENLLNAGALLVYQELQKQKVKKLKDKIKSHNVKLNQMYSDIQGQLAVYSSDKKFENFWIILSSIFVSFCCIAFVPNLGSGVATTIILIAFIISASVLTVSIIARIRTKRAQDDYYYTAPLEYERAKHDVIEPAIKKLEEQIAQAEQEANEIWEQHKSLLDFLSENYRTLDAIGFMLKSVKDFGADTLERAKLLYQEELRHREQMGAIAQQNMLQQRQMQSMNDALIGIQQNQQLIHDDLKSIQTLQALDFYKQT